MTAFGSWRESTTGAACLAVALTACAVAAAAQSQELVDVREALTLAQGEYLTGDHQRALDRLEAVLASPATAGQRLEAFVLRARCLVQQGEVEKAR